eukprot:7377902-Prymnesium_polylepis.2
MGWGARRGSVVQFAGKGGAEPQRVSRHERRVMRALERRVLNDRTAELRGYFEMVCRNMRSLGAMGGEEALSATTDEDLEQLALLFAHYDLDSDGLLSRDEFSALLALIAEKDGGAAYSGDHLDKLFLDFDVDGNQVIDFNELLLLHNGRRPDFVA